MLEADRKVIDEFTATSPSIKSTLQWGRGEGFSSGKYHRQKWHLSPESSFVSTSFWPGLWLHVPLGLYESYIDCLKKFVPSLIKI